MNTPEERIERCQILYNESSDRVSEVEAFLSLYYLSTFLASALQTAKDQLAKDGRDTTLMLIDGILTQNEENR